MATATMITSTTRRATGRLMTGVLITALLLMLALTIIAARGVPDQRDGWRGRLERSWYGITALAGVAIRDGEYQLDDARRLTDHVDPDLESYFGRRGAELLVTQSPDGAERLDLAVRLNEQGDPSFIDDAVRFALDDGDEKLIDPAFKAVKMLDEGSRVRREVANVFGQTRLVDRHGLDLVLRALGLERTPFLLNQLGVSLPPAEGVVLLEEAHDADPDDLDIAASLWIARKLLAVETQDGAAAAVADEGLDRVIAARGQDAPARLAEVRAMALAVPTTPPVPAPPVEPAGAAIIGAPVEPPRAPQPAGAGTPCGD